MFNFAHINKKIIYNQIYLWSKVVCFIFSHLDLPNHGASCHALGIFKKLSISRGAPTWFETLWIYGVETIDYWTIFSMEFGCILGVVGKPSASQI